MDFTNEQVYRRVANLLKSSYKIIQQSGIYLPINELIQARKDEDFSRQIKCD